MTTNQGRLTSEQIELLHHVELARAGWQTRVVDQLVLSAALAAATPQSAEVLNSTLRAAVDLPDGIGAVAKSIQRLIGAKTLVEVGKGQFAPSEVAKVDATCPFGKPA